MVCVFEGRALYVFVQRIIEAEDNAVEENGKDHNAVEPWIPNDTNALLSNRVVECQATQRLWLKVLALLFLFEEGG